jgi:predicted helicase
MVLAALSTKNADADLDGYITVAEARDAIRHISPVMAAAFAPLVDKPVLFAAVEVELGALETLISAINPEKVNKSADKRGEPWLYFYEDFLSVYDPEERKQAGVYYTPTAVVKAMVRIVDHIIVEEFGIRLGFADSKVVTLDPATGTGTFPLAVIDRAAARAEEQRGAAGAMQAAQSLAANLFAFELLPGPYSVAHLRLSQRLKELNPNHNKAAQVILTDTLESPVGVQQQWSLFGDAEVLATEQNRAKRVKADQRVTVVIGNPPYRRLEKSIVGRGSGGWVVDGAVPGRKSNKSLFDDILDVAKKETIFSHHASLYNLYVYFWRWAIWKAFEAHGDGPGVVAFITGSSWLTGPGFVGLRKLVREVCDEAWILDLGGDNKGSNPEENVFAIETPVAVVILVRKGTKDKKTPARINYRRISGTAGEKIKAMDLIANSENPLLIGDWITPSNEWMDVMTPATGGQSWFDMPALTDIFPLQQPGCKFGRTWPIAPHSDILQGRWKTLSSSSLGERSELFVTAKTGRNIHTKVAGYIRLDSLRADTPPEKIVRYGYRSFDRQWVFSDPRLAELERPALWQSFSGSQIFIIAPFTKSVSAGPCVSVSAYIPDLHVFRGSFGGKDVIPLYRDAAASQPNITKGLQKILAEKLGIKPPTPEDIAAYVYALLSVSHYQERFAEELKTPGPRVPITADPKLWQEAVTTGRYLLWLHTYAERFQDASIKQGKHILPVPGISWAQPVTQMPQTASDTSYDPTTLLLKVGNGCVTGVRNDVWAYCVSGMPVMKKWLGYRTIKGAGRAASSSNPLDRIRPTSWPDEWNDELLDLIRVLTLTMDKQQELASLLDKICSGTLIATSDLPKPKPAETKPPA